MLPWKLLLFASSEISFIYQDPNSLRTPELRPREHLDAAQCLCYHTKGDRGAAASAAPISVSAFSVALITDLYLSRHDSVRSTRTEQQTKFLETKTGYHGTESATMLHAVYNYHKSGKTVRTQSYLDTNIIIENH